VTNQRRLVYETLMAADDHPTAAQIYDRLRGRGHLSRTSVYRSLDLFVRLGLAVVITDSTGRQRFDRNLAPHFHAVCMRCRKLHDIDQTPPDLNVRKKIPAGFSVRSIEVEVRGFCSACRVRRWKPVSDLVITKKGEESHEHARTSARRIR
jgi:Fe2+ or Zn2+ uptake regulation protein